jgi:hypothetical protein
MQNTKQIDRRSFIKGAITIAGASAAGAFGVQAAEALPDVRATVPTSRPTLSSLHYWDGKRLVALPAEISVGGSAPKSTNITLTIWHGHMADLEVGRPGSLKTASAHQPTFRALDFNYAIPDAGTVKSIPFHAWAASDFSTPLPSRHRLPLAVCRGVSFTVNLNTGQPHDDHYFLALSRSEQNQVALRTGTYVLASGVPDMSAVQVNGRERPHLSVGKTQPVTFEHMILVIEEA